MRFGLDDGRPKTLEKVGEKLGVTRERIRQIQEEALIKMRVKIAEHETPTVETEVYRHHAKDSLVHVAAHPARHADRHV